MLSALLVIKKKRKQRKDTKGERSGWFSSYKYRVSKTCREFVNTASAFAEFTDATQKGRILR